MKTIGQFTLTVITVFFVVAAALLWASASPKELTTGSINGDGKVWNEHTATGAHESKQKRFPTWVPSEVIKEVKAMSVAEAESILSQ